MRYRKYLVCATISAALLGFCAVSSAQITIGVAIRIAPPALPVYVQPAIPAPGYLWVPGYWAWSDEGYYWVPGTWVSPPQPDLLWTPGYWGWSVDGTYVWHEGYWGPHVGFYGGVNYGFGYTGVGYVGGYWAHGAFFYNNAVNHIGGVHITNVYTKTVVNNTTINYVSFNGGPGGLQVRPTAGELAANHEPHVMPVAAQRLQEQTAGRNPALRAAANHGRPPITASAHAGAFGGNGHGAAGGRGAAAPQHSATFGGNPRGEAANAARGNTPQGKAPQGFAPHDSHANTDFAPHENHANTDKVASKRPGPAKQPQHAEPEHRSEPEHRPPGR